MQPATAVHRESRIRSISGAGRTGNETGKPLQPFGYTGKKQIDPWRGHYMNRIGTRQ